MTDADDDSVTLRSIRVTASHAGMSVLGDDNPGPTDRTAAPAVLDLHEPVSLLESAEPTGLLRRHTGFLGSLRTSDSLHRPFPALVFRPAGTPAAQPDDAPPDASRTPSRPMQVAVPRLRRTGSRESNSDDTGRSTASPETPPERRTRQRIVRLDAEPAAPTEDAPPRGPTAPRLPEFTYVSPPWVGEPAGDDVADTATTTPFRSEDLAGPDGRLQKPDAREGSRRTTPEESPRVPGGGEQPGATGRSRRGRESRAGVPRPGGPSAPGDPGSSPPRDVRPTDSSRGRGPFPVSVSLTTDSIPPRGLDRPDPPVSGTWPGRESTVAARTDAAAGSPSTADAGIGPISRTPLTVARRLADASPGQAAVPEDDSAPAARGAERAASEPPGATTLSPGRSRPRAPGTASRPRFTVVDRPKAASPRSGTAEPSRPDAARRSSLPGTDSTGGGSEAPADVADDVSLPDPDETVPDSVGRQSDPMARRRTVDVSADETRVSPTAPGRTVPLVVRRRKRRDRPDDAAGTAPTGRTRAVGERAPAVDPAAVAGPDSATTPLGSDPAASFGATATDDLHRLPLSVAAGAAPGGESLIKTEPSVVEEMPSMTLRDAGGGGRRSGEGDAGPSRPSSAGGGGSPERGSADALERNGVSRSSGTDRPGGVDRRSGTERAPARDATHGREASPPSGRDTSTVYPAFTFKTLAPRIDATRTETSERRDVTHRDDGRSSEPAADRAGIAELLSAGKLERSTYPADVDRLVEKLQRDIERKRRIDRERRGL